LACEEVKDCEAQMKTLQLPDEIVTLLPPDVADLVSVDAGRAVFGSAVPTGISLRSLTYPELRADIGNLPLLRTSAE
jgi:hypothetical protein